VSLQTASLKNEFVSEFKCKWMVSGFDTASSIALISVTALAKKGPNGTSISNSQIVLFPVFDAPFRTTWTTNH
jgi:hypothetical protein